MSEPTLTIEKLRELRDHQQSALNAHMWAMPEEDKVTTADQELWEATQAAVWALEEAVHILEGYPERPWTRAALKVECCATCRHCNFEDVLLTGAVYCTLAGGFYNGKLMQRSSRCEAYEAAE